jgi:two-component system cell cycle sensor histidine kinase/response regulator CckA
MQELIGKSVEFTIVGDINSEGLMKRTILLVEDEEMIRGLMCEVLEREGYEVLACADPKEGIDVCLQHSGKIDLLLTDVMMPGMNGRVMANRILEIVPELRVVFMSGYSEQFLLHDGEVDPHLEYLQKPFTLETLTRKLSHVLGKVGDRVQ